MRILLTGATGTFGRGLAARGTGPGTLLRLQGRAAAPPPWAASFEWASADMADGRGLIEAASHVDVIIHAATDPRRPDAVDVEGTRRLLAAADAARVGHLLYISIVGVDRIPHPYYGRKLAAEQIVAAGPVPWSILRLTQFHPFVEAMVARASRVPFLIALPKQLRFQSLDVGEAAARVLAAVAGGPAQRLPDFGGPEVLTLGEVAATWRDIRGVRKPIMSVPWFGKTAAAFRAGFATASEGVRGVVTFADWLRGSGSPL